MIQVKTKSNAESLSRLKEHQVLSMLKKVREFILEFKKAMMARNQKTPGQDFELNNIRVVLVCAYEVPKFLGQYFPDLQQHQKLHHNKNLEEFFKENQEQCPELKRENFIVMDLNHLKAMYGPTFRVMWESIINEAGDFEKGTK